METHLPAGLSLALVQLLATQPLQPAKLLQMVIKSHEVLKSDVFAPLEILTVHLARVLNRPLLVGSLQG